MGCGSSSSTYKSTSRSPTPTSTPSKPPTDILQNGSTNNEERHQDIQDIKTSGHHEQNARQKDRDQGASKSKPTSPSLTASENSNDPSTSEEQTVPHINSDIEYLKDCETFDTEESFRVIESLLNTIKSTSDSQKQTESGNVSLVSVNVDIADFVQVFIKVIRWFTNYVSDRPQPSNTPPSSPSNQSQSQHAHRDTQSPSVDEETPQIMDEDKVQENIMNMKRSCILVLSAFDEYETVILEMIEGGATELLLTELEILFAENRTDDDLSQMKFTLFILSKCIYNADFRHYDGKEAREAIRQANGVEILMKLLEFLEKDNSMRTLSSIVLCFIVDDAEADMLAKTDDPICLLVSTLEYTVESDDHKVHFYVTNDFYFFGILGILDCLYKLADNDSCKKQIVMNRGTGVLVRILQEGFTDNTDELQMTIDILWKLTFGGGNCKEIVRKKLVNCDCVQGDFLFLLCHTLVYYKRKVGTDKIMKYCSCRIVRASFHKQHHISLWFLFACFSLG